MAGTEIDELSLKISVQGATPTQTKNINAFAQSLEKLDKALPTSLIQKLDKLSKLSISMRSIQQAQNLGGKASTGGFGAIPQLKEQQAQTKQFTEYLEELEKSKATIKDISKLYQNQPQLNLGGKDKFIQMYGKNHKEREEHAEKQVSEHPLSMGDQAQTKIDALLKRREKIAKLGNTINSKVLSPLKKFGRRFGVIASLMIICQIIISIMKLFQEGIRNFGQVDKSANETMSRLQTAWTNISNSVSMIFMPMLEMITPLVEQIAQAFANVANFVSESVAQMKGLSKYTKISADYMAEYQANAGGRASFDTFNALSSSAFDMFDEEKVGAVTEKTSQLQEIITSIKNLVTSIFEAIKPIFTLIMSIISYLTPAFTQINIFLTNIFDVVGRLLNMVLSLIDPIIQPLLNTLLPTLLSVVNEALNPIFELISVILDLIDPLIEPITNTLFPTLLNVVNDVLNPIYELIGMIVELLNPIVQLISNTLLPSLLSIVNNALNPICDLINMILDLLNPIIKPIIEVLLPAIMEVANIFLTYIIEMALKDTIKFIEDIIKYNNYVVKSLNPLIDILKSVLTPIVENIAYTFDLVSKLMKGIFTGNWDGFGKAFKNMLISVANFAIGIIEAIVNGFLGAINNATRALSSLWTWAFGEGSAIPQITWKADWRIPYLAQGGMVNAGSMFVAGERGAELVTNLGGGQTGVMNIAQFTEAVVNGINQSGVIEAIKEGGNIYLDNERVGAKVGTSKGLRQSLNRTNPALGLK